MNKLNFLPLGLASLGSIAALGIATTPVQAQTSTFEWDDGTSDFVDAATAVFTEEGSFDVEFSPGGQAAVFIADGIFADFFPGLTIPPDAALVNTVPTVGTFSFFEDIVPPPGVDAEALFRLDNELTFEFDTDGDTVIDLVGFLPEGSPFLGILNADGSVEFDLEGGASLIGADGIAEWTATLPDGTIIAVADSSIFEFGQTAGSSGGAYIGELTTTPEPASILGLLAVGGLGLGLKRKKQS